MLICYVACYVCFTIIATGNVLMLAPPPPIHTHNLMYLNWQFTIDENMFFVIGCSSNTGGKSNCGKCTFTGDPVTDTTCTECLAGFAGSGSASDLDACHSMLNDFYPIVKNKKLC